MKYFVLCFSREDAQIINPNSISLWFMFRTRSWSPKIGYCIILQQVE